MAGLIVKYVQKRGKAGWRYRRKVPEELRERIGKTEIVIPLGRTEEQAVRRWPSIHAQAERLLREAQKPVAGPEHRSELDQYHDLIRKFRALGFDPDKSAYDLGDPTDVAEWDARSFMADQILDRYPVNHSGDPTGVSSEDVALIRALNDRAPARPGPTLADAKKLYLKERIKGHKKKTDQLERVIGLVEAVVGKNRKLASITRTDAREVRDHMLDVLTSPSSVDRYLNVVRAMVNCAITELELTDFRNPFTGLEVPKETVAKDDRKPFTPDQLEQTRERILCFASADLQRIWRILEGTGCRLAEVAGLLVSDVHLEHRHPYLDLVFHPHRRLKTKGSIRRVPLVGDALEAAKEAVSAAKDSELLFPVYGPEGGNTRASAALMKHVRACVSDKKVSVHSLRHNMKDRLISSGASSTVQDLILGHSSGAVSEAYGGPDARLEVCYAAISKKVQP